MPNLIDDTMLDTFCVSGTYDEIGPKLKSRFGPFSSRLSLGVPNDARDDDKLGALLDDLHRS